MAKLSHLCSILAFAALLGGCANREVRPFDGMGALGLVTTPGAGASAMWSRGADGVIRVSGKPAGYIATRAGYANYRMHVERRWPGKPGHAGDALPQVDTAVGYGRFRMRRRRL